MDRGWQGPVRLRDLRRTQVRRPPRLGERTPRTVARSRHHGAGWPPLVVARNPDHQPRRPNLGLAIRRRPVRPVPGHADEPLAVRIAIVGAGGFIGKPLAAQLIAAGHEVIAIGRANAEHVEPVEVVLHLSLFNESDARAALARWRGRAGRFVAISSGDGYRGSGQLHGTGPWDGTQPPPLDEDAPLRAGLYPYGRSTPSPWGTLVDYEKILVERALPDAVILRLPKVYGPGDRNRTFAREIAERETRIDEGLSRWRWPHGDVDDVAAAIALAAGHPRAAGRIFNVGERETPTM